WPQIDSGVLTVEVRWREYPLTRRQEGGTRTRAQFAAFGGYPFHMWSDADLVGAGVTIVAGHCPHRVGPVAVVVARDERRVAVDDFASRVSLRAPMCRRESRLLTQDDPQGRLALLPIGLVENGALDRRGRLRQQRTRVAGNKDGDAYAQCRYDEQPCCSARRTSRGRQNEPPAGIPCSSLLR